MKDLKEYLRFGKFVLFSASAGIIQVGSFALFDEVFHWPYWLCYLLALVLSVLWNFTLNRKFTFRSAANVPKAMLLIALYYAVFTPLTTLLEHYLAGNLGWNEYIPLAINMLLNVTTEYLYQKFVVYRGQIDNAVAKSE